MLSKLSPTPAIKLTSTPTMQVTVTTTTTTPSPPTTTTTSKNPMLESQNFLINQTALPTPCLIVYKEVIEQNIRKMQSNVASMGISLRVGVEIHRCLEIADLQTNFTKKKIIVSTLA